MSDYYTPSGIPASGAGGLSAPVRTEFSSISAGFGKFPALSAGNENKALVVNGSGTAIGVTTGTFILAGNFQTTGTFNTIFAQSASITLALPGVAGTLATLAGTETLTNKTLTNATMVNAALGTPVSGNLSNCTGTALGLGVGGAVVATNQSGGTVNATSIITTGAIFLSTPIAQPVFDGAGWQIYVDIADGKLKAIASSGPAKILAP